MLTLYIQLQLWFIKAEPNIDYSFLNENYIETLKDDEKIYFFEHQMYKTKQIIDSRALKKLEYTNNVHICIGMSNDTTKANFLNNQNDLVDLIIQLFNKKLFCGFLIDYLEKSNLDKNMSKKFEKFQSIKSDINLIDNQMFFTVKNMYNTMFQLYYNLKIKMNVGKKFYSEVPKDVYNYKAFFQFFSQTKQINLSSFFSGNSNDAQILYFDNCNKNEADLYYSFEYLRLALPQFKSYNRLILISISEKDCCSTKIDEILKKIACLQTKNDKSSIKVCKLVNLAVLGLKINHTTFNGLYDINLKKKRLETHKKEIDGNSIFKSAMKIKLNIIDDENLNSLTKSDVYEFFEKKLVPLYNLNIIYDEKIYKMNVFKKINQFRDTFEINYEFQYNKKTVFKLKFDVVKVKNTIKIIQNQNNTQIYNFLENILILSEFSFKIYSKLFDQRLEMDHFISNKKIQNIEHSCFHIIEFSSIYFQSRIENFLVFPFENLSIEIPFVEDFCDSFEIKKNIKENKLSKYENIINKKDLSFFYKKEYFEFIKKDLFIKLDFYINYTNECGLEEKYKVKISPSLDFDKMISEYLIQFLTKNKNAHDNLLLFIDINFPKKVSITLNRYSKYELMTYRPHLFCFLEKNFNEIDFKMLYRSIFDKKHRILLIKFYCKIFFIKKNLLQLEYANTLYKEFHEYLNLFCDPLVYFEKFLIDIYKNELSNKYLKDLGNHSFFKIFDISDDQKLIINEFIYLLDSFFLDINKYFDDKFKKNILLKFEISISKCSFYGTRGRIKKIFNFLEQECLWKINKFN